MRPFFSIVKLTFRHALRSHIFQLLLGVLLFAVLFIFVGIQMFGIGLIGEYIGRIYTDVRARPAFFIDRVLGRKDQ